MNALNLLNKHLEPLIELGGKMYPQSKVDRVYAKLSSPKAGTFYEGSRVRGEITPAESLQKGTVQFSTYYPEVGYFSDHSPEELGIPRVSPVPGKELIKMQRAFQDHVQSNQGKGLYLNTPLSEHRREAYSNMGIRNPVAGQPDLTWQDVPGSETLYGTEAQVLDNRRFKNNSTIAQLYGYQDARNLPSPVAQVLREDLVGLNPHLQQQIDEAALQGHLTLLPPV